MRIFHAYDKFRYATAVFSVSVSTDAVPYPAVQEAPAAFGVTNTPTVVEHSPEYEQPNAVEAYPGMRALQFCG